MKGRNIPLDLHLELLSVLKSFLKDLGPNMTEQATDRISKSIVVEDMLDTTDAEFEASKSSGIHHAGRQTGDILAFVEVVREAELLKPNQTESSQHFLV